MLPPPATDGFTRHVRFGDMFGRTKRALARMIWFIFACIAVLYAIIVIIMYIMQPSMVYFPSRTLETTPRQIGLDFEEVSLVTGDEVRIHGWFIPADSARGTILFCHGNAGNISHRLESIQQFHRLGLSVFIFDYHGYGQSEGKPGETATYLDAESAWRYLTGTLKLDPQSIIVFGRSLGGAVATWLAARHHPKALIIESSFTSLPDIAAHYYPYLPVRLLSRFQYNSKENLRNVNSPVLIIHSPDDDIIPFRHGRKLYELANEPKQFLRINGTHNDGHLVSESAYIEGLETFLARYVDR